jgi:uncharacterized protein YqgV (UPF0045/DUF77 family)
MKKPSVAKYSVGIAACEESAKNIQIMLGTADPIERQIEAELEAMMRIITACEEAVLHGTPNGAKFLLMDSAKKIADEIHRYRQIKKKRAIILKEQRRKK